MSSSWIGGEFPMLEVNSFFRRMLRSSHLMLEDPLVNQSKEVCRETSGRVRSSWLGFRRRSHHHSAAELQPPHVSRLTPYSQHFHYHQDHPQHQPLITSSLTRQKNPSSYTKMVHQQKVQTIGLYPQVLPLVLSHNAELNEGPPEGVDLSSTDGLTTRLTRCC